jgi:hypothetical protein
LVFLRVKQEAKVEDHDVIEAMLPKKAAALVIDETGDVSFMIPNMEEGEVPDHVLAVIEMAMRVTDGDTPVHELAETFRKRKPS